MPFNCCRYQATSNDSRSLTYGLHSTQPALPPNEVHRLCREYKNGMALSEGEISQIEAETQDQGDDVTGQWLHLRRSRITSSNFGVVCKRRASTPVANLVKSLLYHSASTSSPSLRWGRENEDCARRSYVQAMHNRGTPVTTRKVGLVISREKPHLACSPDNLVEDTNTDDIDGVVEFKCPYSARDLTPSEACTELKAFYCKLDEGRLTLKHNHNYFYQIQGVMAVTKRKWCDFVIWTPKGISIERIKADTSFWGKMEPKLDSFWDAAILPELAAPEHTHKRPIREPGTWEQTLDTN